MGIIKERIRPEFDEYNFERARKRLNLLVIKCIHHSFDGGIGKWMIRGYEMEGGREVRFEIDGDNLCRKIRFNVGIMDEIKEGECFRFMWKVLTKKKRFYRCFTNRFRVEDRMEIFEGFRRIEPSSTCSFPKKHSS